MYQMIALWIWVIVSITITFVGVDHENEKVQDVGIIMLFLSAVLVFFIP